MSLNCTSHDIQSAATFHHSLSNNSLSSSNSSESFVLHGLNVSEKLPIQTDSPSLTGRVNLLQSSSFTPPGTPNSVAELTSLNSSTDSTEEDKIIANDELLITIHSNLSNSLGLPTIKASDLASSILKHSAGTPTEPKRIYKKTEDLPFSFHLAGSKALIHNRSQLLGMGGFKMTWKSLAVDINSGETTHVAWAKPRKDTTNNSEENLLKEIELHKSLKHENIVELVHSDVVSKKVTDPKTNLEKTVFSGGIFMESCDTDLHAIQQKGQELPSLYENREHLQNTLAGASQSAAALAYLHDEHNLAHNDFKPDNIFLKDGQVKLGDFGLTAPIGTVQEKRCTLLLAPEQRAEQLHPTCSAKTDIFQFGLTMGYVIAGPQLSSLFQAELNRLTPDGRKHQNLLQETKFRETISELSKFIPQGNTEELEAFRNLAHIIERCVKTDPADRPQSMREVKEAIDKIASKFPNSEPLKAFHINAPIIPPLDAIIDVYATDIS